MQVASKVGKLPTKFGQLGLWVLELFAMYTTDGRPDRRIDGQKQCILPNSLQNNTEDCCSKAFRGDMPILTANQQCHSST